MSCGVGFLHEGTSVKDMAVVEQLFQSGAIQVLLYIIMHTIYLLYCFGYVVNILNTYVMKRRMELLLSKQLYIFTEFLEQTKISYH